MMDSIPFEDEILRGTVPTEQSIDRLSVPTEMQPKVEQLDDGQRNALNYSLSSRVALIQG
jgi:hypothetical protein